MGRVLAIVVLFLLIFPESVLASITVDVSGNGEGSRSTVDIKSNVKSSTTTNQNFKNTTDIRIETNGEVKEYHGEGDTNIKLESSDGNNSVSIISGNSNADSDIKNSSKSATIAAVMNKQFNLLEFIKEQIDSILTFFKSSGG